MKITIDLKLGTRYYGNSLEYYEWSIKVPRKYVTERLDTSGTERSFDAALEAAREAATEIYKFNKKKNKFPYVEDFIPEDSDD